MIHTRKLIVFFFIIYFSHISFCSEVNFDDESFLIDILCQKIERLSPPKRPKVALVLGGGGARGIAHIGVLMSICKHRIPVDLVIGTSVGSIIGAFYCAQVSFEKMYELAEEMSVSAISNIGYISILDMLLTGNLFSNDKLEKFINKNIGIMNFDELKIPLICVTTDLNTGERVLLREGSVAFASRASASMPGIFRSPEYKQRYLVDGGLVENVPVNVAKIFDSDVIIAVAVSADITRNKTNNVMEILMQALYIQGKAFDSYNLELADVIIQPEVGCLSIFDFKNSHACIGKGFSATEKAINDIKKAIINKTEEKYLIE